MSLKRCNMDYKTMMEIEAEERKWENVVISKGLYMNNYYFEAVEVCPHCDSENIYRMWDVNVKGFVAIYKYCGKEIMLCDECIHNEDNLNENCCGCDWHKTEHGGECFRGITR